jgi:signal transduction histidine kinase
MDGPDGRHRVIRMSAAPVMDSQEQQLAAVATVYDVTAEQEHEERREFLQEATRVLNSSLEVEATFQALARLVLGRYADWCVLYRRGGDATIERVAAEHVDPAFADAVRSFASGRLAFTGDHPVARVIRENEPLLATEVTGRDIRVAAGDDEQLIAVARTLTPTSAMILPLTARGEAIGALSVVRSGGRYVASDIELMAELAERAALALDNALLFEKARSADAAKSNFLAVMSHEFRTPLSAILGYADILTAEIHGGLNDRQRTHLERVKASVRHLSHLVDEILSFASMEAGRERVRKGAVDVTALAGDVVAIMEPIAEAAGLELRTRLPDQPVSAITDASKVRQILINLLSNALKYTVSGSVSLTLVSQDDRILCGVRDTGPGIPEEHAERVFEPFWQVDRNDGRRISGTGLGLSVARRLARLLGGDLRLEPPTDGGSLFILDLPMETPDGVADGQTA